MKAFFLSRLLREKILLIVLAMAAAAMWLSSAGKRASRAWSDIQMTSVDLADQKATLEARASIEARANAAATQLDRNRTFDSLKLQSEVETILQAAGLGGHASTSDQSSDPVGQFRMNSVTYTIRNAEYSPALLTFYDELKKRAPYIGIESFRLQANPSNKNQLSAIVRISSVEIPK